MACLACCVTHQLMTLSCRCLAAAWAGGTAAAAALSGSKVLEAGGGRCQARAWLECGVAGAVRLGGVAASVYALLSAREHQ